MLEIITMIRRLFAPMIAAILMLGVSVPNTAYTVKDPQTCLTNFSVVSDVHMEGNNKASRDAFIKELYDVKNNAAGNDALVLLGDSTMNGQHIENMFLYGILNRINPADRIFTVLGNHDTGNGVGKYNRLVKRFHSYYNDFYNDNLSAPYYEKEVNGYIFLFLGSEADSVNSPVVSNEQFSWLNARLAAATADGKPAFVFGHHPYTHYENPQALLNILTAYKNVFFFNGHMHLNRITVTELADSVYSVNLPRFTELNDHGETFDVTGQGVNVEIYENTVILRERNFYTGTWMSEHEIPLA